MRLTGGALWFWMVMLTLALIPPVQAQSALPPPHTVDLATVLQLVREVSPRLAVDRETIAQAEAELNGAGAYPNPKLAYGVFRPSGGQATLFDGSRQQQTIVELPLLVAGQRAARVEMAERGIEAARARVRSGASSLAAETGAAFVALLAAQEKTVLIATAQQDLTRLRGIVAGRESAGVASRYELARVDVELGGLQAKSQSAGAEIADRAGDLAALLGLSRWRPVASGSLATLRFDNATLPMSPDRAFNTPAAVAAAREEEFARSGIEVARRERWPVPAVSVGRSWTESPFGAANFFGLSVELPVFDTRRGPLAKAVAATRAAELRRELALGEAAANLQRFAEVIARRQAALERFEQEAGDKLPVLRQMAEDAYQLGRGSILELLDATRSRYDLQQTRIDLAAALIEAQLRLLALRGELDNAAKLIVPARSVP